jgi:small subunit ribosomal protein S1
MAPEDEDFAAMLDASFAETGKRGVRSVRKGESVEGPVVQIGKDAVFVDIGTRSEGVIDRWELQDRDGNLTVKVGDRVRATVESGGERPKLVVALGRGGLNADALTLALETGSPVEGTFTKAVKAGIEVDLAGVRAFCPASQVDTAYVADLTTWEGQRYRFKVIDVRDGGRSVVVSRKAIMQDEREAASQEVLAQLEVGSEIEGSVSAIQPYGAFIDLGGVEGLVHISELGHGRVDKVEDVVSVGEKVRVRVLEIEGTRIKLSMRQGGGAATGKAEPDKIVDGKVTNVESYGVFVQTEAGTGLVPSKELVLPPGADPKRAYQTGQDVRVLVLGQDAGGKLRLSIRRVEDAEARAAFREFRGAQKKAERKGKKNVGSLGELLMSKLGDVGADIPDAAPSDEKNQTADAQPAAPRKGKRRRV